MTGGRTRRGEFELIAEVFSPLTRGAPGALGLTDDAALLDVAPGMQLVTTVDTLIADVHFRADDPPGLVARKALRVNLSDLAAKGARPIGFLHALVLNDSVDDAFLEAYARGMKADTAEFGVPLLGGDTTSGPGPLTITITAFGEVEKGHALLRNGAQAGDALCVSGTIGDGAIGLACLNGELDLPDDLENHVVGRYQLPQPRFIHGSPLASHISACMDISDGLVGDIAHLCKASGVSATLDRAAIPLSQGARHAVQQDAAMWDRVLGGGDDYELAFTLPQNQLPHLQEFAAALRFPLTCIGTITDGPPGQVTLMADGKPLKVAQSGYRHR